MIVSLTDSENDILNFYSIKQKSSSFSNIKTITSSSSSLKTCHIIGGKAASLQKLLSRPNLSTHIPKGLVLTVAFFQPWMDIILCSNEYRIAKDILTTIPNANDNADAAAATTTSQRNACNNIKSKSQTLPLTNEQSLSLSRIRDEIISWDCQLAAVRSSAPYEDGDISCFAGIFETMLGVTVNTLEQAVRGCFASVFDYRVFSYVMSLPNNVNDDKESQFAVIERMGGFSCVVMEMVDAISAGVAFSSNPLNSDLDELVIDGSWGLGECVVDGSVEPDHVVWNKLKQTIISHRLGSKKQERRLKCDGGGVTLLEVDDARQH